MSELKQLLMEQLARVIHVVTGCLFLGASGWSLFIASAFNPWVFWAGLLIGSALLGVGIFGSRKAALELLYLGV